MTTEIDTITLATDKLLKCPKFRAWLKMEMRRLGISDREAPCAVQSAMEQADRKEITLQYAPVRFEIPLVDDVWVNPRYLREFYASRGCRHPEKDRLIALLVQLIHAGIYRL
ncbi:MAG: hypothetical protein AAF416_22665 [Pseudomonadota bacterium]